MRAYGVTCVILPATAYYLPIFDELFLFQSKFVWISRKKTKKKEKKKEAYNWLELYKNMVVSFQNIWKNNGYFCYSIFDLSVCL